MRLNQATVFRNIQAKMTNATSDIASSDSLFFHSKGDNLRRGEIQIQLDGI